MHIVEGGRPRAPTSVLAVLVLVLPGLVAGCNCSGGGDGSDAGSDSATGYDAGGSFEWDSGPPLGTGVDPTVPAACGEARAGVIEAAHGAALIGGTSAEGRTGAGDVLLHNCRARFIIQGARAGDGYLPGPGALIDADVVRPPGEDGWDAIDEFDTMFGPYTTFAATEVGVLSDGTMGGPAIVRAIGTDAPLEFISGAIGLDPQPQNLLIIQDYVLEPDATAVRIDTRFVAIGPHSVPLQTGDFVLLADDGFDPFAVPGPGFDRTGHNGLLDMIGTCGERNEGCLAAFAVEQPLNFLVGSFLSTLGSGDISIFPYFLDLISVGNYAERSFTRYLAVGADVDDLTREFFGRTGTATLEATGLVSENGTGAPVAGARVHLIATTGGRSWTTMAITAADGTWDAAVPPGDYDVVVTGSGIGQDCEVPGAPPLPFPFADGRGRGDTLSVTIDGSEGLIDLGIGPAGQVDLTISDGNGIAVAAKVIFSFAAGDPTPNDPMLGERNAYGFARKVAWTTDGSLSVAIEPGTYDITAARGFDAEIDERPGEVVDPSAGPLALALVVPDVVDHTGYWSADNHLHAAPSIHGEATVEERVVTNITEGLDFFIAADHDIVIDYQPVIEALGLEAVHKNFPGVEVSPLWGHFIPYPVTPDPTLPNFGAPPWWESSGFSLAEIVDWSSNVLQAGLVQINHGRSGAGYFTAAGFDPLTGAIDNMSRWDATLEVMEIVNGKGSGDREALLVDWYALLNLGFSFAGTGVSDSHHKLGGEPGYGRTYYYMPTAGTVAAITAEMVTSASLGGAMIVSGGPFVVVSLLGETVGGTAVPAGAGPHDLLIEVRAPSWMEITTVDVIANGLVEQSFTIDPLMVTPPLWLSTTVQVDPSEDTWYIVRVDGGTLTPLYPGAEAFAATNPIYLDLDGDGFDAPGL